MFVFLCLCRLTLEGPLFCVSWLSVAAVLAVEFARTISMALAIAEFLQKPCKLFDDKFVYDALECGII